MRFATSESAGSFEALEPSWNRLALKTTNPFLTHEWVSSWWRSFGGEETMALTLSGDGGELVGAAALTGPAPVAGGAMNAYSAMWDVVAADDASRLAVWRRIGTLAGPRISFPRVPEASPSGSLGPQALEQEGFTVVVRHERRSPYIVLPGEWEELLASLSGNSRSQVRKKRRRLERAGKLEFRTTLGGPRLEEDLDQFFRLEASGWKGDAGTAILHDPPGRKLFSDFAHAAARRGWLRLQMLNLDGETIAADYSCVLGDSIYVLKTCFDERHARLSPGAVLRAESIRSAIEDRLSVFEWLGEPDSYKLHWGGELRQLIGIHAYRGSALPAYLYHHRIRPAARRLRALTPLPRRS